MRALKVLKETLEELVKGYSRALSEHDWSESTRAWGEGVIKGLETAIEVVEIALDVEARFATDGGNEECGLVGYFLSDEGFSREERVYGSPPGVWVCHRCGWEVEDRGVCDEVTGEIEDHDWNAYDLLLHHLDEQHGLDEERVVLQKNHLYYQAG